ncbi:MAG: LPS export ABC transporter periplasmic protein LptC [Gammaproteobacteria bacterium]|nr:LPS export ABC transporter periplasmic protein LptC [Gammaproteobacteria bacterium]
MTLSKVRTPLFALILALLALWLINPQNTFQETAESQTPQLPAYSWKIIDSTSWQFDRTQPNKQMTLQTTELKYRESDQTSQFSQPIIRLTQDDGLTVITSDQGESVGENLIQLSGHVVIQQSTSQKGQKSGDSDSTLHTEHITYNAKQGRLHSEDKVTLKQTLGTTTAKGLDANLQTGTVHFLSDVKGIYHLNSEQKAPYNIQDKTQTNLQVDTQAIEPKQDNIP